MNLIEQILADVGNIDNSKPKRPVDIKYLGYEFAHKVSIRDTGYILYELLDEDTHRPASFCFLVAKRPNVGIVIPFPFKRYYQQAVDERKITKGVKTKSPNAKRRGNGGKATA